MPPHRYREIEAAFDVVVALRGRERDEWLDAREREDPDLVAELRELLEADAVVGVLDVPPDLMSSLQQRLSPEHARFTDALPLPARAGPYVISGEIGRGGMGVVCRAHDPRLNRDVAIKIFPVRDASEADAEQRVLAEARAASALDHAHICTIYDVGTLDDGRPYLAMAYYGGGTLADRLKRGALPVCDAAEIAAQVAEALAAAHAANIVHRDVKPHNVAFADGGIAKLLDFGVAQLREGATDRHSAGTPAYMTPEQARGEPSDARTDLWSLGVMLYEMLAGRRPFAGADRESTLRAIVSDDPHEVRLVRQEVPATLSELVQHLLRKPVDERPATAAEVAAALRGIVASHGETTPVRAQQWMSGPWIAVTVATLLTGIVVAWLMLRPARSSPPTSPDGMYARAVERLNARESQATEQAIALLRHALTIDSSHARAHALLARAYLFSAEMGQSRARLDSANAHAARAIALQPSEASGFVSSGAVLAARGRHSEAVVQFRQALDLAPRNAQAMLDLSGSHMALNHFDEAFVWMERALATDPALPGARALAVARYNVWEIPAMARRHIAAGLRVGPADTELLSQLVLLDLHTGDTAAARTHFQTLLPLESRLNQLRLQMHFELRRGNFRDARAYADRLIEAGGSAADLPTFGMIYRRTGAPARGDSLMREWLATVRASDSVGGRRSSRMAVTVAYAYAALGHRENALRELARFDSLQGLIQTRPFAWERGWDSMRDDPRYQRYIARAHERFRTNRSRIVARLVSEKVMAPSDTSGF